MQDESTVSQWLSGADDAGGLANPAGPLYMYGEAMTKAATADSNIEIAGSSTLRTCVFTTQCC